MSILFALICIASLLFFAVFLVQCSRPRRAFRRSPVARKVGTTAPVDSAAGRRALIHLEQQMAEFLSTHGRSVAVLLLALSLVSAATQMKAQESASPTSITSAVDEQISPVIQKQLDAMQSASSDGINVDAGIFLSYIGLFSRYNSRHLPGTQIS